MSEAEKQAEAEAESRIGLCDPANFDLFVSWYTFGGIQHGMTPMQVAEMPAAMRQDFTTILARIEKERKRRPKKKPKNGKKQAEPQTPEDLPPGLRDIVFAKLAEEKQRDQSTAISQ